MSIWDWVLVVVVLFATYVLLSLFSGQIERVYGYFLVPLARGMKGKGGAAAWDYTLGIVRMAALYCMTGIIFGMTGGTTGALLIQTAGSAIINAQPSPDAKEEAKDAVARATAAPAAAAALPPECRYWFLIGLLIAGGARLRGSLANVPMVDQITSLAVLTGATGVFLIGCSLLLKNPPLNVNIASLRPTPDLAAKVLASSFAAALLVEGLILFREYHGGSGARAVTRAGLRHRVEAYDEVEQVFLPQRVEPVTHQLIHETILESGVRDICWMTDAYSESTCNAIREATMAWVIKNKYVEKIREQVVDTFIKANVRIIAPTTAVCDQIENKLRARRRRVTQEGFRHRVLILNGRIAITFLPVPADEDGEQEYANLAAICRNTDAVHELQAMFDNIWENTYFDQVQREVSDAVRLNGWQIAHLLLHIAERDEGVTLAAAKQLPHLRTVDEGRLRQMAEYLLGRQLLCFDDKLNAYRLKRRRRAGQLVDFLTRLCRRDLVRATGP